MIISKIFSHPTHVARTIYDIHRKEIFKEHQGLDEKKRIMENIKLIKRKTDLTILEFCGDVLFRNEEKILLRSLKTLGYRTGLNCKITIHYTPDDIDTSMENYESTNITVTGYIKNVKPKINFSGYCDSVNVTVIMEDNVDDVDNVDYNIHDMEFILRNTSLTSTITFYCIPCRESVFRTQEEAEAEFVNLWNSKHGIPLLCQFITGYTTDINFKNHVIQYSDVVLQSLDRNQCNLLNAICSDNLIVSCDGPAGSGKTITIANAFITGMKYGKTFLYVGSTHKSCDSFIEKYQQCDTDLSKLLLLRSKQNMLKYPDVYKISESYYFTEGLSKIISKMLPYDQDTLLSYEKYKKRYFDLKSRLPVSWKKDFVDKLNYEIKNLHFFESDLPILILKYIKPHVFISTIDDIIDGKHTYYLRCKFDCIVMDDVSQVTTSKALILLRKFPNSNVCYLGDTKQFPPPALYGFALDEYEKLLSKSILDVMNMNTFSLKISLSYNYRCPTDLVRLISCQFYNGLLLPIDSKDQCKSNDISLIKPFNAHSDYKIMNSSVYFLNTPHLLENKSTDLSYDVMEGNNIAILLLYLFSTGVDPSNIAVICIYEAQIDTVKSSVFDIMSKYLNHVANSGPIIEIKNDFNLQRIKEFLTISGVEKYQGSEIDYVIISTSTSDVMSNDTLKEIYELNYRICTAITRPKKRLFILGDTCFLSDNTIWGNILRYINTVNNCILPFNDRSLTVIFQDNFPNLKFIESYFKSLRY